MKFQGIQGKVLRLETASKRGLSGRTYDDRTQKLIATNGYHEGIEVKIEEEAIIFDNIYSEGIQKNIWLDNFLSLSSLSIIEFLF